MSPKNAKIVFILLGFIATGCGVRILVDRMSVKTAWIVLALFSFIATVFFVGFLISTFFWSTEDGVNVGKWLAIGGIAAGALGTARCLYAAYTKTEH